ncbi:MAG: hypothetical protein HUJ90_01775 [Bacteroidales bacterium]|nr:hypothetical protein [Bacteroidales bacterium]
MTIKAKQFQHLFYAIAVIFCLGSMVGCDDGIDPSESEEHQYYIDVDAKSYLEEVMTYRDSWTRSKKFKASLIGIYYWYDDVPERSFYLNEDINSYFKALRNSKDQWSWMMTGKEYVDNESGIVSGTYGAAIGQAIEYYDDYGLRIKYVYPDSPFGALGVRRGWQITAMNGVDVTEITEQNVNMVNEILVEPSITQAVEFTFKDENGKLHVENVTASAEIVTSPALETKIFTAADYPGLTEKVGYFHYLSFKSQMMDDIDEAMAQFKAAGVHKLILDLRYNTGGDMSACDLLAGYIAPKEVEGQIYNNMVHNDIYTRWNESTAVTRPRSEEGVDMGLDLDKVYIITGEYSASASEVLLNGLLPLMDIEHVGDTTYGKPNGMYVMLYPETNADYAKYNKGDFSTLEYVFLPICFYNKNGAGNYIPDNGIVPENLRPDDLYHDFDASEDNINACLHHIVYGSYPDLPAVEPRVRSASHNGVKANLEPKTENPLNTNYLVPISKILNTERFNFVF